MKRTITVAGVGDVAVPDDLEHRDLTAKFYARVLAKFDEDFDAQDTLVFRGDTRSHTEIFRTGFAKQDYGQMVEVGALVRGGISTSTDLGTVKQKYGGPGMYIYACVVDGYDLNEVNALSEILALYIPPDQVIACAGPVTKPSGYWGTTVVSELVPNVRYTRNAPSQKDVMVAMGKVFRRGRVSESPI